MLERRYKQRELRMHKIELDAKDALLDLPARIIYYYCNRLGLAGACALHEVPSQQGVAATWL